MSENIILADQWIVNSRDGMHVLFQKVDKWYVTSDARPILPNKISCIIMLDF